MSKQNKIDKNHHTISISGTFFRWLLVIVAAAFLISMFFTWLHLTKVSQNRVLTMLSVNVWDVNQEVIYASHEAGTGQAADEIEEAAIKAAKNRHVGTDGSIIILNEEGSIVYDRYGMTGEDISFIAAIGDLSAFNELEVFRAQVYDEMCLCEYMTSEGYYILAVIPESEVVYDRNSSLRVLGIVEILVFLAIFIVIYMLIRKRVSKKLDQVNASLSKITEGDLDETADVRSNTEFSRLSDHINSTVGTLKTYIAQAEARIDEELKFAKNIQQSALPSVFPPYPDRGEFSIYADMDTAKAVGGDFYDFYFIEENTLAFLVADVSGKGIPAAMFMMESKTVIRDYAERGDEPADIFINANAKLSEGNDAGMFLTAWMGLLQTDTGLVRFVNAGHNAPVLIRDGRASFIEQKVNLILALMEGTRYREQTLTLEPGDILYLYTDGVTEACRADGSMFGDDRLLEILCGDFGSGDEACRKICETVRKSIMDFVQDEPQFDDITQVCLCYSGTKTNELIIEARESNLYEVLSFVDGFLGKEGCGLKEKKQIGMAVEEIFINIANYAYPSGPGEAAVCVRKEEHMAVITITDSGIPYDPLEKPDPDLNMDIEDRQNGGFGIYMAKTAMDDIQYERRDSKNILTMKKTL